MSGGAGPTPCRAGLADIAEGTPGEFIDCIDGIGGGAAASVESSRVEPTSAVDASSRDRKSVE
jgi:hypothetical protein